MRKGEGAAPAVLLNWVAEVMKDNPTTILGIYGHADSQEARPDSISLARATTIRDSLVLRGFPVSRFKLEALGASSPLIDSLTIDRMATDEERQSARQDNRRVHLSIIDWNWKP
jgi:outer membrane protein OmpA-like peptidoglycan-associated protein